ncbi:hypothetical protein BMH32_09005 [Leucobacter sp. OLJS4]|uniref:alternate-type signal peptide domain-containing protein n=1 Tax=unclassified Leucobacter TaxID=2621730 RepID=UPI000C1A11AB|nr:MULTISPECIES: alternate-type signal peptide domain-containing protein [unclassified Leucobacter]PII85083.1 hypothetical protein BMH25_02920 [Leucobacter sp. OLCALW19]PII89094.1 hypothetical protein BMH26_04525 [Leucobacter sp. OLTLW20]PII93500.1 hypothetical protein BMH27_03080 [Leucobacter sp. OLAS13]PII98105.1 hypothetical protein BMH29_09670 [Leucobacter sp. OLDS2]PIJ02600.1 hypothetical protein BMH28_04650 [Leucobacter sp. OLCS4]
MTLGRALGTAKERAQRQLRRVRGDRMLVTGIAVLSAGILAAGGAAAFALWQAQDSVSGGRIVAGDLNLTVGTGKWQQVTAGVEAPASGPLDADPAPFVSMPGDTVEIVLPVTTTLQGDNLNAQLLVDAGAAATADIEAGRITASYRIEDADGVQAGPASGEAELGEPISVAGLESSSAGSTVGWNVVVTVNVIGDYRWTAGKPLLDLSAWSADDIDLTLQQVRSGDGFTSDRTAR